MNAIVFLDFDDVLSISNHYKGSAVVLAFRQNDLDYNTDLWVQIFDSILCANLRALHDEFKPQYVISSSWASLLEQNQIVELFKRTGLQFVSDNLHQEWRTPRTAETERAEEIAGWLDVHNAAAPRRLRHSGRPALR
ncbi:HAD domain-containing protein [Undibacterium terreum]|uniref:HAD domain-containing protein n=1 Tax=Undibacterium terreum TaxID=1224302 RepID=UPI00166AFE6E|nr:HAD domain-containing protein [Undibacterium terreum]